MKKYAAIALVLAAASGTALAADPAHTIAQSGRAFHPVELTIGRGESLTFTNNDEFIHQIYLTAQNFNFDTKEKAPGEKDVETFTEAGTFQVHCHIHPKMQLVVHVN
jgi:plastocyanin